MFAVLAVKSKFSSHSKESKLSSPIKSLNETVPPKKVTLYKLGLLFFITTLSNLITPSLNLKWLSSILAFNIFWLSTPITS